MKERPQKMNEVTVTHCAIDCPFYIYSYHLPCQCILADLEVPRASDRLIPHECPLRDGPVTVKMVYEDTVDG